MDWAEDTRRHVYRVDKSQHTQKYRDAHADTSCGSDVWSYDGTVHGVGALGQREDERQMLSSESEEFFLSNVKEGGEE